MIKKGQDLWNKMYNDKQVLLGAKEEYIDSMKEYCLLKKKMESKDQKKEIGLILNNSLRMLFNRFLSSHKIKHKTKIKHLVLIYKME